MSTSFDWIVGRLARTLPPRVQQRVKQKVRAASIRWDQWRYNLTARDFVAFLSTMGVQPGDVLFVHSSFDAFRGFSDLPPLGVIKALQEVVGDHGTLAMPTLPFTGSAIDYAAGKPTFDVRRTPSRMGLVTELFRRMPGVVRSVHPTHSAAVWGRRAHDLVNEYHTAQTRCDQPSPYHKLLVNQRVECDLSDAIRQLTETLGRALRPFRLPLRQGVSVRASLQHQH